MSNTILYITSSAAYADSVTRPASKKIVDALQQETGLSVVERDVAKGLPLLNEDWLSSNHVPEDQRSEQQKSVLAISDELIAELQNASHIVMAVPMYNFGIPASLKAWIDQVTRAGITFRYTENGPEGLLGDRKTTLVVASGGMPIGHEPGDFVTPYLKFWLGFLGVQDVTVTDVSQR